MKRIILLVALLLCLDASASKWERSLGIGGSITASDTIFHIMTTSQGSVPCPKMSAAQRDAFTPLEGHCVWNTDDSALNVYDGGSWGAVAGGGGGVETPATTLDRSVVLFNGTDGASLTDSTLVVDSGSNLTGIAAITASSSIQGLDVIATGDLRGSGVDTASAYIGNLELSGSTLTASSGDLTLSPTGSASVTTTASLNVRDTHLVVGRGINEDVLVQFDIDTATKPALLYDSTSGLLKFSNNGVSSNAFAVSSAQTCVIRDEKAANTVGGTGTAGSFVKRDLNVTEGLDCSFVLSLSSSVVELAAGSYIARGGAPGFIVGRHRAKLRNTTDGADLALGSTAYSDSAANRSATTSNFNNYFTILASKTIELQHRIESTMGTRDFGVESNMGIVEIYSVLELTKVD